MLNIDLIDLIHWGVRFGTLDRLQLKFELFEIECLILLFCEEHPKALFRNSWRYKTTLKGMEKAITITTKE